MAKKPWNSMKVSQKQRDLRNRIKNPDDAATGSDLSKEIDNVTDEEEYKRVKGLVAKSNKAYKVALVAAKKMQIELQRLIVDPKMDSTRSTLWKATETVMTEADYARVKKMVDESNQAYKNAYIADLQHQLDEAIAHAKKKYQEDINALKKEDPSNLQLATGFLLSNIRLLKRM